MSTAKLERLYSKASTLRSNLKTIEEQIAEAESELRTSVYIVKLDRNKYTMTYKGRTIKLSPHRGYPGYDIRENGKVIASEVREGINTIRLRFALGRI